MSASLQQDDGVAVESAGVGGGGGDQDLSDDIPMTFPQRLMEILSGVCHGDVITWLPHGKAFIIYKKKRFAAEVLPKYFKQSKFTSFTRKLNRWGFTRVTRGPETGAYFHKFFVRDDPRLCMQMSCQNIRLQNEATTSTGVTQMNLMSIMQMQQLQLEQLQKQQQLQAAELLRRSMAVGPQNNSLAAQATNSLLGTAFPQVHQGLPQVPTHQSINMPQSAIHQAGVLPQTMNTSIPQPTNHLLPNPTLQAIPAQSLAVVAQEQQKPEELYLQMLAQAQSKAQNQPAQLMMAIQQSLMAPPPPPLPQQPDGSVPRRASAA